MAEKIWKIGAYTRLSRDDGDKNESESIGSQKEIIRDFIRDRKDMVIIQEYVDDGYSGVNFERPGFKQMMDDVRAKRIDCIIGEMPIIVDAQGLSIVLQVLFLVGDGVTLALQFVISGQTLVKRCVSYLFLGHGISSFLCSFGWYTRKRSVPFETHLFSVHH